MNYPPAATLGGGFTGGLTPPDLFYPVIPDYSDRGEGSISSAFYAGIQIFARHAKRLVLPFSGPLCNNRRKSCPGEKCRASGDPRLPLFRRFRGPCGRKPDDGLGGEGGRRKAYALYRINYTGHGSWVAAAQTPGLLEWLFSQTREEC